MRERERKRERERERERAPEVYNYNNEELYSYKKSFIVFERSKEVIISKCFLIS